MIILILLKWISIDIYRFIKNIGKKKNVHLYGIHGYFGLYGKGKTMSMTYNLSEIRKKYGDNVYISTNYFYKEQDFPFTDWKQLLVNYDKPLVIGWDEVQNEFTSRNFRNFPVELLTILTQNRKGNGIQIHYTAQRFDRVDKIFRELTMYCYQCNTLFNRLGSIRKYHYNDYEKFCSTVGHDDKNKIINLGTTLYVQTDHLRNLYDSYRMIESAKSKEYMDRSEVVKFL